MSKASMRAASFKKWKCEIERGRYEENKQTIEVAEGKTTTQKKTDSLYHSNNIIITGDEASRLQVGNISICILRWTKILWFNGRLFSGTLFGFTNSCHLKINVLGFCIKATIWFFYFLRLKYLKYLPQRKINVIGVCIYFLKSVRNSKIKSMLLLF